jgi:hypothetical protein
MAEDPETPEEETHPAPAEPAKGPGKGRAGRPVDRPVSLFPLSFEEAVDGLLQVKPEPETSGKARGPKG